MSGSATAVEVLTQSGDRHVFDDSEIGSGLWERIRPEVVSLNMSWQGKVVAVQNVDEESEAYFAIGAKIRFQIARKDGMAGSKNIPRHSTEIGQKENGVVKGIRVFEADGRVEGFERRV